MVPLLPSCLIIVSWVNDLSLWKIVVLRHHFRSFFRRIPKIENAVVQNLCSASLLFFETTITCCCLKMGIFDLSPKLESFSRKRTLLGASLKLEIPHRVIFIPHKLYNVYFHTINVKNSNRY